MIHIKYSAIFGWGLFPLLPRQRSWGKVMFSAMSVCSQGGCNVIMDLLKRLHLRTLLWPSYHMGPVQTCSLWTSLDLVLAPWTCSNCSLGSSLVPAPISKPVQTCSLRKAGGCPQLKGFLFNLVLRADIYMPKLRLSLWCSYRKILSKCR